MQNELDSKDHRMLSSTQQLVRNKASRCACLHLMPKLWCPAIFMQIVPASSLFSTCVTVDIYFHGQDHAWSEIMIQAGFCPMCFCVNRIQECTSCTSDCRKTCPSDAMSWATASTSCGCTMRFFLLRSFQCGSGNCTA